MQIIEVTDINGIKRKVDLDALDAKQFVAKDGDKISFTMMAMDCAGGLFICDADQLKGHDNMTTDEQKIIDGQKAANASYIAMCAMLDYRTKNRTAETPTQAYDEARHTLENAWRNGR